jgi:hypothetical protein
MVRIQSDDKQALFSELKKLGAGEFEHLNGSLEKHLHGTAGLLRQWGANEDLIDAGLFHAVYGTAGYAPSLAGLDFRKSIASLIGQRAEEMVYLYCACDRERYWPRIGTENQNKFSDRFMQTEYPISDEQVAAFCEMTLANELEIILNDEHFLPKNAAELADLFSSMKGVVSEAGFETYKKIFGNLQR